MNSTNEASTRTNILKEVDSIINGDRAVAYGKAEDNFGNIASLWSAYCKAKGISVEFNPLDVALMLDLMKTARIAGNMLHRDSWIDKVGYAACGAGIVDDVTASNGTKVSVDKADGEDKTSFTLGNGTKVHVHSMNNLGELSTLLESLAKGEKPEAPKVAITDAEKGKALLEYVRNIQEGSYSEDVAKGLASLVIELGIKTK